MKPYRFYCCTAHSATPGQLKPCFLMVTQVLREDEIDVCYSLCPKLVPPCTQLLPLRYSSLTSSGCLSAPGLLTLMGCKMGEECPSLHIRRERAPVLAAQQPLCRHAVSGDRNSFSRQCGATAHIVSGSWCLPALRVSVVLKLQPKKVPG